MASSRGAGAVTRSLVCTALACSAALATPLGIRRQFLLSPVPSSWALPDSFVLASSVRVWDVGAGEVKGWRMDAVRQVILLPHVERDSVWIEYRFVPLGIPRRVQRHAMPTGGEPTAVDEAQVKAYPADLSSDAAVRVTGTKTIGVRFGAGRDPSLDQALQLQVAGTLGGDVEVSATLTDESTPIQPEGTTQELRDLEQVAVQLVRRGDRVVLGDCAINLTGFQFLTVSRSLQGASLSLGRTHWQGWSALAFSRGTPATVRFFGREGIQGPYPLGASLSPPVSSLSVVAGTERVYLDGVLLSRGSDKDYVIDYSKGELTFTQRHPITSFSSVEVDFQYTSDLFRRAVWAAGVSGSMGRGFSSRVGVFRESDDVDRPTGWSWGEDERRAAASAGDDAASAVVPTYRYVGFGRGRYDTLHVAFFVKGPGGGWEAQFDSVGTGQGEYRRVGQEFEYYGPGNGLFRARGESTGTGPYRLRREVILVPGGALGRVPAEGGVALADRTILAGSFEATFIRSPGGDYTLRDPDTWVYVGPGHGEYVVTRRVPLPRAHTVAVAGLKVDRGATSVDLEVARSDLDVNTLSQRDAAREAGALHAELATGGRGGVVPWWQARATWRAVQGGFQAPGRFRAADWERQWASRPQGDHQEATFSASVGVGGDGSLGLSLGTLGLGSNRAQRAEVVAKVDGPAGVGLNGRWNLSWGSQPTWRAQGTVERSRGWGPVVAFTGERQQSSEYRRLGGGFSGRGRVFWARALVGRRREREVVTGHWVPSLMGWWWEGVLTSAWPKGSAKLEVSGSTASATARFRRARADANLTQPEDVTTTLGVAQAWLQPWGYGPRVEVDYKVSGQGVQEMREELVREKPWETNVGEYDSLGHWVGPEAGTHKKELVPTGRQRRADLVQGVVAVRLPQSARGPSWRTLIHGELAARTQVTSTTPRVTELYLLRPSVVRCDSTTLQEVSGLEGHLGLRLGGSGVIAFHVARRFEADRRRMDMHVVRRHRSVGPRLRGVGLWGGSGELQVVRTSWEEREMPTGGRAGTRTESRSWRMAPSAAFPVSKGAELTLSAELSHEEASRTTSASAPLRGSLLVLSVTPGVQLARTPYGHVLLQVDVAKRQATAKWTSVAPFVRRTERHGWAWVLRVSLERRLQERLTARGSFQWGRTPERPRVAEGAAEMVAYF